MNHSESREPWGITTTQLCDHLRVKCGCTMLAMGVPSLSPSQSLSSCYLTFMWYIIISLARWLRYCASFTFLYSRDCGAGSGYGSAGGGQTPSNSPKPTLAPQHILMPVNSFPILWPPPLVLKEWGPHTHIPPSPFLCAVAELGPHLVCDPLQVEDPPAHTWAMLMPQ